MTVLGPDTVEPLAAPGTPGPLSGPTVLRIILGGRLRRLRETNGISRRDAGEVIRASESKISRLELGRVAFKERDVADLLTLYGVTDEQERGALLTLARQANTPGWWHRYGEVVPDWFELYVGLEQAASLLRVYEVQFVPGLLQNAAYAEAVIRLGHPDASDTEIARRVELRMRRRELLTAPGAPTLWAVMDEAVLRRPLGGAAVMGGELRHLLELAHLPNVTIQVVPFQAGGHAAAGGPFTILRFAEPDLPDVVYLEQLASAVYLDRRDESGRYMAVMDRLCVQALDAHGSMALVERALADLA